MRLGLIFLMIMLFLCGCRPDDTPERIVLNKGVVNSGFTGIIDTVYLQDGLRYGDWSVVFVGAGNWVKVKKIDSQSLEIIVTTNYDVKKREGVINILAAGAIGELRIYQASDARGCPRQTIDSLALVALYEKTQGKDWYFEGDLKPDSKHQRWDFGKPFRTWSGIECIIEQGQYRVSILDISSRGATGVLPGELDSLSYLQEFYAGTNRLDMGSFEVLCKLEKLSYLDLGYNGMQGDIPTSLINLTQLMFLDISGNQWSSDFPSDMRLLTELRFLNAANCRAKFTLEQLRYNSKLERLDLANNQISCPIPEYISNFTMLEELDLSGNAFEGEMPGGLTLLKRLRMLKLAENKLSGDITSQFQRLEQLEALNLSSNKLSGVESGALSLPKIEVIDLSFNEIQTLEVDGGSMSGVTSFFINHNKITNITGSFEGMAQLEVFNVSSNKIVELPLGIEKCGKLTILSAGSCQISVLPDLSKIAGLKNLDLSGNKIGGVFPLWMSNFRELVTLDLANNQIIGTIPGGMVNVTKLRTFMTWGNRMSGEIPLVILNDARCKGELKTIPWEENPNETRTFFVPGQWDSWRLMWPQQNGFKFSNVPPEPNYGAA